MLDEIALIAVEADDLVEVAARMANELRLVSGLQSSGRLMQSLGSGAAVTRAASERRVARSGNCMFVIVEWRF